jgi:hypothetical protein
MANDDRPLFRSQRAERVVERRPIDDRDRGVGGRIEVEGQDPDACSVPPRAPDLGVSGIDDQAIEPAVEAVEVAERG